MAEKKKTTAKSTKTKKTAKMVIKKTTKASAAKKAGVKSVTTKKTLTKTTTKKTPVKTTTRKNTTKSRSKKVDRPIVVVSSSFDMSSAAWVWFFVAMLLGGLFIGTVLQSSEKVKETPKPMQDIAYSEEGKAVTVDGNLYVSANKIEEGLRVELAKGSELAVYGGKTWIPVPGNPIEVIAVTDKTCTTCNITNDIAALRQNITPALLVRTVDVRSEEGKKLMSDFAIKTVPQYILGDGVESFKGADGKLFVEAAKEVLTKKDGKYAIIGAKTGFKSQKFIAPPAFADLDKEPVKGKGGKVRVVEFTDYQCPFCKRLHDTNKTLIDRLVKEGKIEYIVKDFPLGFHAEAPSAHKAANCVLQESGNEAYWKMNNLIFENGASWQKIGPDKALDYFVLEADKLGVDIAECVKSTAIDEEIKADQTEGSTYGVSGTPALFIGKSIMPGAIDATTFEAAVEAEMATK